MKTFLWSAILLVTLTSLHAQRTATHSMHFRQNGFIQNEGQFYDGHGRLNKQVEFLYAAEDFHIQLSESGFSYELIHETQDAYNFPECGFVDPDDFQEWRDAQPMQEAVYRVDITFSGANPHPLIIRDQKTETVFNYYLNNHSITNVPSFNRITYKNIYKDIDLVFEDRRSENGDAPEYSFIVRPGGDARQIKMTYAGAGSLDLEDKHTLSIALPHGFIKETSLHGYWLEDGSACDASFSVKNSILSFNVVSNKNETLIIDPSIVWGSYFGGSGSENLDTECEIALDNNNSLYLSGSTSSANYIATTGAVMQTYGGNRDMLLAKFSLDGKQVLWATYFGGSGQDNAYGVCCDSHNNVLLTGFVKSANVITTPGVFQTTLLGRSDVLLAKFTTNGQLIWSTLMGGSDDTVEPENGRSLICDAKDNVYVCGYATSSSNIASTGAYQTKYGGNGDAFLAKFTSSGQKIWGTYFSGSGKDRAHCLCFDPFGHVYIGGTVQTKRKLISNGFQTVFGGNVDGFVAKFDSSGKYYWSSYYGGAGEDHGRGVKCDGAGYLYFDGFTGSNEPNICASSNCFQPSFGGVEDGFIAKFTPTGNRVWGTYLGGTNGDYLYGMTIDDHANLYVNGHTTSGVSIATSGALQTSIASTQDALIAKFDSSGNRLWATYFGGSGDDFSYDIERDNAGMLYLVLDTFGPLPVSPNAYQTVVRGQDDLAVFEFDFSSQ